MILFLDFTNKTSRVAAVNPRGAVWFSAPSGRSVVSALAVARKKKPFSGKPSFVAVAQGVPGTARDVSWSGVRSAVAAANALAFAFGVSVGTVPLTGSETEDEIAALVRAAARGARKGAWAGAAYSGEPTITVPAAASAKIPQ